MLSHFRPAPSRPRSPRRAWLAGAMLLAALPLAVVLAMQAVASGSPAAIVAALLAACASVALAVLLAAVAGRMLARDAQVQACAAEAAGRAGDEFISVLGHELRNPLGAISAAADVLESPGTAGETATEARAVIARQARGLSHVLDELLDLGRLTAGKALLAQQPVDLAVIAQRLQQHPALTASAQGGRLSCRLQPAWARADAARLEQALTRLVTEALPFAAPGRAVVLSARAEGGMALLQVEIDSAGRSAGGIGLAVARRLAELHGGALDAVVSPQGSRFSLRLPAVAAPADGGQRPIQGLRKVLVVEGSGDMPAALRPLLEPGGHSVMAAVAGREGLTRLLQQRPEVCIVDIEPPAGGGLDLARQARAAGYAGRMIALCGAGFDAAAAMEAGFDACLAKPLDEAQLRASLGCS